MVPVISILKSLFSRASAEYTASHGGSTDNIWKRRTGPHMMNIFFVLKPFSRISPGGQSCDLKFLMFILCCVFSNKGELCNQNTCENNVNKQLAEFFRILWWNIKHHLAALGLNMCAERVHPFKIDEVALITDGHTTKSIAGNEWRRAHMLWLLFHSGD